MQTQILKTYQLTPVRMVMSKQSASNKCWRGCGKTRTLGVNWDVVRAANEHTMQALWKGKHSATNQWIIDPVGPITRENENQKSQAGNTALQQYVP